MELKEAIEKLDKYRDEGIRPDELLQAALRGDLIGMIELGDTSSLENLHEIRLYLDNEMPLDIWGSLNAVEDHIEKLQGTDNRLKKRIGMKWIRIEPGFHQVSYRETNSEGCWQIYYWHDSDWELRFENLAKRSKMRTYRFYVETLQQGKVLADNIEDQLGENL